MTEPVVGHVAKILNGSELLLNKGRADGVVVGDFFEVLDTDTLNIKDPVTGEDLGSLDRYKIRLKVHQVDERLALCLAMRGASYLTNISRVLAGTTDTPTVSSYGTSWPEQVRVGDPVRQYWPSRSQ